MPNSRAEWWQRISSYLDEALELEDGARARWLNSLRKKNPALTAELQTLLCEHRTLAQEGFLEQTPLPLPNESAATGAAGPYALVKPIGQGGMGSVWVAERSEGRFKHRVAIKFLNVALPGRGGEQEFQREGSILSRLTHPHIAKLMDSGISPDGRPYLVLEHVAGEHIDRYCDAHALDVESRVRLFLDVLAGVAHAHANRIVHRDIKPSNVLVRTDGQVKLLDFGISTLLEDEESSEDAPAAFERGAALTPQFAAPEQLAGGSITFATDIYALGVLLYILLAGHHPAGPGPHSPADLIKATVEFEPPLLSAVVAKNSMLRGDLENIVAKALKKNPQERYISVTALADDLSRFLKREPVSTRFGALVYRTTGFVYRNRGSVALAMLAFGATIAGVVRTINQAHTARAQS
jgi:serine/threonine-protein kinase